MTNILTLTDLCSDCGSTFTQINFPPRRFLFLNDSSLGIVQLQPDKLLKPERLIASPGF